MTNLRWAFAPFLALVLGIGIACGGDSDDDTPGASTTTQSPTTTQASQTQTGGQTTSQGQTPSGATGTLDTGSLAQALEDVESFRFNMQVKMNVDMPQGGTGSQEDAAAAAMLMAMFGNIRAEGSYVAPDRIHIESSILGMRVQFIQIGEQAWVNDGTGWRLDDGTASSSLPFDTTSPAEFPFEFIPAEKLEGAETSREQVNGVQTTRYRFDKDALIALAEAEGNTEDLTDLGEMDTMNANIWITDDGLPIKMLVEAAGESEGTPVSFSIEFNVTDVNNSGISIEPPL